MKLFLQNGVAFFRDIGYIPGADLNIELEIPGMNYNEFALSVKVNDLPSRSCKTSFTLKRRQLEEMTELKVKVIVKHRKTGVKQEFDMDPLPLKKAFAIGGDYTEMYPVTYMQMFNDMQEMKKRMKLMTEAMVELGRKGDIL